MKEVLNKMFSLLKYLLLITTFGLVFFCLMSTYSRLGKSMFEAVDVFIPFVFVLVMYIINIIIADNSASKSLLFNFVSCLVFVVAIIVCLRSILDKNMLLYYKYQINFNPAFFADNLSAIEFMFYVIGGSNVLLLVKDLINKKGGKKIGHSN